MMCQDGLKPALWRWALSALFAVGYAAMAGSCDYQPEPAAVARAEARRQAAREAAALSEAYEKMSDAERMRGVVYEPAGEQP